MLASQYQLGDVSHCFTWHVAVLNNLYSICKSSDTSHNIKTKIEVMMERLLLGESKDAYLSSD